MQLVKTIWELKSTGMGFKTERVAKIWGGQGEGAGGEVELYLLDTNCY